MPSLNVRDYLLAGACGLALLCAGLLGVQSWRLSRAEEATKAAQARELGAKVQAALSDRVLKIEGERVVRETIIRERADDAADQIAARSDGDAPLPAGLNAAFRGAIGMLRGAEPSVADPGPSDATRRVPPASG